VCVCVCVWCGVCVVISGCLFGSSSALRSYREGYKLEDSSLLGAHLERSSPASLSSELEDLTHIHTPTHTHIHTHTFMQKSIALQAHSQFSHFFFMLC